MNENDIGKVVVDAAVKVHRRDGIERIVNGLPEENLGVSASLRETKTQVEPNGAANAPPAHR
jgi:hypothetical protein